MGALLAAAAAGDQRILARLLSAVEAAGPLGSEIARAARSRPSQARVVGVTGAPGAGKSTLVAALVAHARALGTRVGVVAVDPSSPRSGGALLADRARLAAHATDPGVFVRSMASRGRTGGLSAAALGAVRVLDAAGWPLVLLETVGAGQADVDVASAAGTTVVVLTPGWGDALQVAKAGLLEVADVLVVNKADRPGADRAVADLAAHAATSPDGTVPPDGWQVPVVTTVATTGEGVAELWQALERHHAHRRAAGGPEAARTGEAAAELRRLVAETAARAALERCRGPAFDRLAAEVADGRRGAEEAADELLGGARRSAGEGGATPR